MKFKILIAAVTFSLVFTSCKDVEKPKEINSKQAETTLKNVNELTYIEMYHVIFKDKSGGMDAHGDLYGQAAISNLKIENAALKSNCGNTLLLVSDSAAKIELAIKATFKFADNPTKEFIRAYTINPTEKITIGTSKVCYNGKEYQITREIISAGFKK